METIKQYGFGGIQYEDRGNFDNGTAGREAQSGVTNQYLMLMSKQGG